MLQLTTHTFAGACRIRTCFDRRMSYVAKCRIDTDGEDKSTMSVNGCTRPGGVMACVSICQSELLEILSVIRIDGDGRVVLRLTTYVSTAAFTNRHNKVTSWKCSPEIMYF
jgi:hypothetical protein